MSNVPENLPDHAVLGVPPPDEIHKSSHGKIDCCGRLGPSRLIAIWMLALNPLTWIASVLAAFSCSPHFRKFLHDAIDGAPALQRALIEFYVWQKHLAIPLWLWPAAIVTIYVMVRVSTTHYNLSDDGILTVKHGLLSLRSPGGPFTQFTDTVPLGLVLDVNLSRGITEMLIGTGTLDLKSREATNGCAMLHHVPHAEQIRAKLMAHSGVRDARVIVSS